MGAYDSKSFQIQKPCIGEGKSFKWKCAINNDQQNKYSVLPVSEKSVKFLGRTLWDSLSDKHQVDNLSLSVNKGLTLINKHKHRPVHILWILQHPFLNCTGVFWSRWLLLWYQNKKIYNSIRKWLHHHNSTTNICLYSNSPSCPLPIKGLISNLKSAKISG